MTKMIVMIVRINSIIKKWVTYETVSYLLIGILTTIVGVGGFALLTNFGVSILVSNTISTAIAILFAYITNKLIVFRSFNLQPLFIIKELALFVSGRFISYACETILLIIWVDFLLADKDICKIVTSIFVVLLNYVISKKKVFKK